MRIATWNVNSVRSRIGRVEAFVERRDVDVLALQETKARDDQWPLMGLEAMGYEVATYGLNQWNGVAIASRVGLADVQRGFEGMPAYGDPAAAEARAIGATCGGVRVWSLYVPNGRAVGDPHLDYKLAWLGALRDTAAGWLAADPEAQVAPIARASAASGSPNCGIPSKPCCTSSSPTREAIATPFHWLIPCEATS